MSEITFTNANFDQEVIQYSGVALVDFWAPWCGHCQMMGPIVEELAKETAEQAKVGKLNVDENSKLADKYNVMTIPTFIIFKNGEVADQFSGRQTKEALLEKIKAHLV